MGIGRWRRLGGIKWMDEWIIWMDILEGGELELMDGVSTFTARTQASSS